MGKTRLLHKWAIMKTASAQLVCEIYKFRMDVMEYDSLQSEDSNGLPRQPNSEIFTKRSQQIKKFVMDSMDAGKVTQKILSLLEAKRPRIDLDDESAKESFKVHVRSYATAEILGQKKSQN